LEKFGNQFRRPLTAAATRLPILFLRTPREQFIVYPIGMSIDTSSVELGKSILPKSEETHSSTVRCSESIDALLSQTVQRCRSVLTDASAFTQN
jgi:hypothetical protein